MHVNIQYTVQVNRKHVKQRKIMEVRTVRIAWGVASIGRNFRDSVILPRHFIFDEYRHFSKISITFFLST